VVAKIERETVAKHFPTRWPLDRADKHATLEPCLRAPHGENGFCSGKSLAEFLFHSEVQGNAQENVPNDASDLSTNQTAAPVPGCTNGNHMLSALTRQFARV